MAKYWGKQIFTHGSFPKVGQKQKTGKRERDREKERAKLPKTHCQLLCTIIGHFLKKISLDGLISKKVFLYIRSAQMIYELC